MGKISRTSLKEAFDRDGYVVARGAIDPDLAGEMVEHVHWLGRKHPDVRPEALHHELLVNDPFIHRLTGDARLLDLAEPFIGPDIALFAAHYIAKRPTSGQAVAWHQDGSYWPLEPMEVVTLWVAGTDSDGTNGCMRVIPGTQNRRLLSLEEMVKVDTDQHVLELAVHPDQIDASEAIDLKLEAGDVSIHNPQIIHGSESNRSDRWRIGLTLRYIPTTTRVVREGHTCLLHRGRATAGIANIYADRPRFQTSEHMPFSGCGHWK